MADVPLLTADAPSVGSVFGPAQWGIWNQNGNPVLTADSVASVEYARDYQISDYPQEEGKFESYNKVQVPYQAKVGFFIEQDRYDFLNSVEAAVASLNFVTVVTPEIQYVQANLTHYSYRREAHSGFTLIRVDVWCEEIRIPSQPAQNGQIASGATASTNAAAPAQSGPVQGTPTTQNAPVATDESVGGGFTTVRSTTYDTGSAYGPGGFGTQIAVNPDTTIPPGVPNGGVVGGSGGGASSTTTPVQDMLTPVPFGM